MNAEFICRDGLNYFVRDMNHRGYGLNLGYYHWNPEGNFTVVRLLPVREKRVVLNREEAEAYLKANASWYH